MHIQLKTMFSLQPRKRLGTRFTLRASPRSAGPVAVEQQTGEWCSLYEPLFRLQTRSVQ